MKKLYIMRGTPGCGKSTKASEIQDKLEEKGFSCFVCSADDYFYRPDNVYDWNPKFLKNAHNWCQNLAEHLMKSEKNVIIIDNTNIKKQHFQVYLDLAKQYGYDSEEVLVGMVDASDEDLVDLYHARNVHGVPRETIKRMMEQFEK